MVIDDVDDALHAALMNLRDEMHEVAERPVFGVHAAVVADGVWTAERPLAADLADGWIGRSQMISVPSAAMRSRSRSSA